jgi:hypothetical protein
MNINMLLFYFIFNSLILFRIYTNLHEFTRIYILNLFENMLTAGLPHTAAPLDSRTLPRALLDTAVRSAAHCRTLHEFECRTPHTAYCTPHTLAHRN